MRAEAFAKVNLSLHVGSHSGGLHELRGLFLSVDWPDVLVVDESEEDRLTGGEAPEVIDGWQNLAWRAVEAVRDRSDSSRRLHLDLAKTIPVAAGLGGGSADAAAALALSGRILGVPNRELAEIAPRLGSDVPFCLIGGFAVVSGTGEAVESLAPLEGFAVALVVPPVEVSTVDVYEAWETMEGPSGPDVSGRHLPPELRSYGPLANDLYPAATAVSPAIDEWRAELASLWARPVMLTGSGPTLFAYFVEQSEAEDALSAVPVGARATRAAVPRNSGWIIENPDPGAQNPE